MNKSLFFIFFIVVSILAGNLIWPADSSKVLYPTISLNKMNLNFGAETMGLNTGNQTFLITNTGTGILNWSISDDAAWFDCSPAYGTNNGEVTVSINASGLIPGNYNGFITVSDPAATNSPQIISVNLTIKFKGETEVPFGEFSTPLDGSIVQSSIPVTGWALDDLQISSVKIYLEQNNQLIYIGDAGFIEDARPDVEQAFPGYPLNYRGGWGYIMLTNFLPNGGNGIFIFHAIANDIEGNQTTLGIHAIECDNANAFRPFGTIDTPPQGDAISGNRYINAGWVLTPKPNYIPTDGSTINVYVDGVKLGHADYNIYRGDVAGLLPGYANSGGAGAAFILDTTLFANGLHVIYWLAADSSGNLDGIGSRYFHIQNMVPFNLNQPLIQRPQAKDVANLKQAHGPIEIKKDFGINAGKKIIRENKNGIYRVKLRELERLEIHLTPGLKSPGLYQGGYLLVGKQLRLLPPGSTFDQQKGIFYWTPGLGFFGEFTFIFIRSDNRAKRIILHILP